MERERFSFRGPVEGEPERSEAQESSSALPRVNRSGAPKGAAGSTGSNRWGADARPGRFCRKARERRGVGETRSRSSGRKKALKGEAHERWELKDVPEGSGADATERVDKPWGWDRQPARQRRSAAFERERKKGASVSGNAEGPGTHSEVPAEGGSWSA
jgi:hypothetical protein